MQEQANEKTVGLVCRTSKMTATTFLHLIDKYLRHEEMKSRNKKMDKRYNEAQHRNDHKRVKVKDLVKDGSGISTVEIMDEKIRAYPVVLGMNGVGTTLGPQIMAEIGDVRRFPKRENLIAFAGVDAPPFQSGKFESKSRHISKRGSSELRRSMFQVIGCLCQRIIESDQVYQFVIRKKIEGKPYYVCMVAGCNKFLRIYYARVKEY